MMERERKTACVRVCVRDGRERESVCVCGEGFKEKEREPAWTKAWFMCQFMRVYVHMCVCVCVCV